MKLLITICLAAAFAASAISADPAPVDPKEAELERAKNGPKHDLPKLLEYNREKLDAVYAAALKAAEDEPHREALIKSQTAWLEFYEADSVVAGWNASGGSYAYPAQVQQKIYQLRSRMYQLATPFMQGWQEVPRVPNPAQ